MVYITFNVRDGKLHWLVFLLFFFCFFCCCCCLFCLVFCACFLFVKAESILRYRLYKIDSIFFPLASSKSTCFYLSAFHKTQSYLFQPYVTFSRAFLPRSPARPVHMQTCQARTDRCLLTPPSLSHKIVISCSGR